MITDSKFDKNVIKYKTDRTRYTCTDVDNEDAARVELAERFPNAEFIKFMTKDEFKEWKEKGKYHRNGGALNSLFRKFFVYHDGVYICSVMANSSAMAIDEFRKIHPELNNRGKILVADFKKMNQLKKKGYEFKKDS